MKKLRRMPPALDGFDVPAAQLAGARRVLVTGLVSEHHEVTQLACDLAEALGAAIDFGDPDLDRPVGPTIARAGAVTADPGEMRDRADLVMLWGCDPGVSHPTIAAQIPPRAVVLHMPPAAASSVATARVLHHLLRGGAPPTVAGPLVESCTHAHAAIERATCVAFVTDGAADPLGLEAWSLAHLVRAISHTKPAFQIPLGADGCATAAAVCTWRYGGAGAIARADRNGGRFLPGEASARKLLARGEVDCVLAIGRLANDIEAEILQCGHHLTVVRVPADVETLRALLAAVALRATGDDR